MPYLSANSLAHLVDSAVSTRSPRLGRVVHAQIIRALQNPLPPFVANHLVNMYAKLGRVDSARLVLSLTPTRSVVTWTSLIAGTVQNGHFAQAVLDFANMRREGITPNDFTLPCVFKAAAALHAPRIGRAVHALAVKVGESDDVFVGSSLFDMYAKTGLWENACQLFDEMPHRNSTTLNSYISAAVHAGHPRAAVEKFSTSLGAAGGDSISVCAVLAACADSADFALGWQCHALAVGLGLGRDPKVLTALVDFYGKCGAVGQAKRAFALSAGPTRSRAAWCAMAAAYSRNDEHEKAFVVFIHSMEVASMGSDGFMLATVLGSCGAVSGFELGRASHGLAVKACGTSNVFVGTALVDMYGKCGSLLDAKRAFDETLSKNAVTMNAMIGAYSHQGCYELALGVYEEMVRAEIPGNYVTFVCLLSACGRAGAVVEGMEIFEAMRAGRHGVEPGPEHYACVVDMLGRAGLVEQAHEFILEMPIPGTVSIWGALLGACRVYRNPELGRIAAENLFRLDPKDSGNHVVLSNMLASSGRWEEATLVRKEMKSVGIKKGAGYSWITVKNTVHTFVSKDMSHERNLEIQATLSDLRSRMKEAGYVPDTNFSLFDVEEEEKASEVWSHSEKIALAFGLLACPPGTPIRITKNLRICGDCHSAFKFVSGIVGREIVVRDNSRFHVFRDGVCSL